MQLRNLLKCTIFLPDTEKSQTAPLGTVWDFYDDRKYIPHNMQSSYLCSLVNDGMCYTNTRLNPQVSSF